MPDYRPNVLPKFAGAPNVADLLSLALDTASTTATSNRERAKKDEIDALTQAAAGAQAYEAGVRPGTTPPVRFHTPEPLPPGGNIFEGEQLAPPAAAPDPGDVSQGHSLADALRGQPGGAPPPQDMLLPGQYKAEFGGFVKNPAQARLQRAMDQGFTPDAPSPNVQLNDQYYLDPSQTPAARALQQEETLHQRGLADAENNRARLRGEITGAGAAGPGDALAGLLSDRPDLLDNLPPFAPPRQLADWHPANPQEARDFYDFQERTKAKYAKPVVESGKQFPTWDQALGQLKDLYAHRNPEGYIDGFTIDATEMSDLADRMARGEHPPLPKAAASPKPASTEADLPAPPEASSGPGLGSRLFSRLLGGGADASPSTAGGETLPWDPNDPPRSGQIPPATSFGKYAGVGSSAPVTGRGGWQQRADQLRELGYGEEGIITKLREEGLVR